MKPAVLALIAATALAAAPATSRANPRALPFTYTTDTLPAGRVEIEQYVDLEPLRAISPTSPGPSGTCRARSSPRSRSASPIASSSGST
jgi:hypothetical protein